jgi:proteasome lid subunit RPN8/RPN11
VTIQHQGGTFATFWRIVEVLVEPLRSFFERTKNEYTRFNYIGEWHSHHSFALVPSSTDRRAMRNVISETGARFIVLLLVRVDNDDHLEQAVTVFTATGQCFQGDVLLETGLG